jgi:hypothetical protein
MKINSAVIFTGLALAISAMPLLAHHSVAGEYDMSKTITIQGTITRVEWMNPHARLWVETKSGDAAVSTWELELPPPNALTRIDGKSGVPDHASRNLFKQGDHIAVTLWRAKDGTLLGDALSITFPDGRIMDMPRGWLFSGAPRTLPNSK